MTTPLEHGYIGLSESVSSMTSSEKSSERCNNGGLNLKATELRLGLPGSESPERGGGLEEKGGYPLPLQKNFVSGAKRGFSDAIDGASAKWVFSGNGGSDNDSAKGGNLFAARVVNEGKTQQGGSNNSAGKNGVSQSPQEKNTQLSPPAAKEQVVGWPPIRSFRKNLMISSVKNDDDAEGKSGSGSLYVKVSLDGAPYLRKIDLKTFACYMELSSALGKMFSCFTIGHCGSHGISSRDGLNESRLMDLLHGSEYVLTYEDKDGDWMLVGDVPWEKKLKKSASGRLFDETILDFIFPVFRLYVYRHMQEDEDHEEFRGDWARPKKDGEGLKPMKKVENFDYEWVVEALKGQVVVCLKMGFLCGGQTGAEAGLVLVTMKGSCIERKFGVVGKKCHC